MPLVKISLFQHKSKDLLLHKSGTVVRNSKRGKLNWENFHFQSLGAGLYVSITTHHHTDSECDWIILKV